MNYYTKNEQVATPNTSMHSDAAYTAGVVEKTANLDGKGCLTSLDSARWKSNAVTVAKCVGR